MVSVRNPASTNFTWHSYKESLACHCVIGAKQIAGCCVCFQISLENMKQAVPQNKKKLKVKNTTVVIV